MRSSTSLSLAALRLAREHLLEFGQCPSGLLNESVRRSWVRSMAAGLTPMGRTRPVEHASSGVLRQALASADALLAHSRPVMEYLFEQVRDSQSVVVLADPRGMLLHTLGDAGFVKKAERVALIPGASWHEEDRGTNAVGTALIERRAVRVHGGEHFLERNSVLTCAASPILSGTGELLGILDISGDSRDAHPHTLGLVSTAVGMIENRLMTAASRHHLLLRLHREPEGIGSMAEGIVAVSGDGWIVSANRAALALLDLRPGDIGATLLERVLDVRLDELLAHQRRRPLLPQALRRHGGALLFAQVQMDTAVVTPMAPSAPAATVPDDALARLDTGDARWRAAADKARRIAGKPIPLLIQGESGVGKELFARAWHASSPRASGPFVAINCSAIPEHLIEAELFGYVAGAFTGALRQGSPGRLREAHGGTLFLDEIGDMPLALQTRLLRVLQERRVTPVGSGESVSVDFALACATHCDLPQAVAQGRFRQDLYYRVNGLTVHLPALRERTDFLALTRRLLAQLAGEQQLAHDALQIDPALLARLAVHPWPGNLRQYANLLRTACALLADDETTLEWQHLPDDIAQALADPPPRPDLAAAPDAPAPVMSLRALSSAAIEQALQDTQGNISKAARQLGISRQTLYRKLRAPAG